jgi:hypothetical protein
MSARRSRIVVPFPDLDLVGAQPAPVEAHMLFLTPRASLIQIDREKPRQPVTPLTTFPASSDSRPNPDVDFLFAPRSDAALARM